MPETPQASGPHPWERIRNFLGLNHEHPKGAIDNIKYSFGIASAIRTGVRSILSLGTLTK